MTRVLQRLDATSDIIKDLIYVAMPIENSAMLNRYLSIVRECEKWRALVVHQREVARVDPNPLGRIRHLIGQAYMVIFDLSQPDQDVAYQLGFQHALGVGNDAVLLVTDDLGAQTVFRAPFLIEGFETEKDFVQLLRKRLRALYPERR